MDNAEKKKTATVRHLPKRMEMKTEPLIDINELAQALNIGVHWIRKHKSVSGLPFYKLGSSVKFRLSEVDQWIKQRHVS